MAPLTLKLLKFLFNNDNKKAEKNSQKQRTLVTSREGPFRVGEQEVQTFGC